MQEQVVCNRCGKKFTQNSSLRQRERDKHKLERCEKCGKTFGRKKALKNHIWFNHRMRRKRKIRRSKNGYDPMDHFNKLSEEEKQKVREKIEANAIIGESRIYTDEERRDLLRDWRELGK